MDQPLPPAIELRDFFEIFQDHLAPKLDTSRQSTSTCSAMVDCSDLMK